MTPVDVLTHELCSYSFSESHDLVMSGEILIHLDQVGKREWKKIAAVQRSGGFCFESDIPSRSTPVFGDAKG